MTISERFGVPRSGDRETLVQEGSIVMRKSVT